MSADARRRIFLASIILAALLAAALVWSLLSRAINRLPVALTPAQELANAQLAYDTRERSRGVRGAKFSELTLLLHDQGAGTLTEQQIVQRLGPPDAVTDGLGHPGVDRGLVYYWSRFGHNDWYVLVALNKNVLVHVSYNDVKATADWRTPPAPYTQPAAAAVTERTREAD